MALIKDGSAANEADVSNGAIRTYLTGAQGAAESYPLPNGAYMTKLSYRAAAADAAASFIWAMRNTGARLIAIRRIMLVASFDGTAAASTSEFELVEVTGVTADSGGTLQPAAKKRDAWPASTVTSIRGQGVVTLTTGTVNKTFASFGAQRQVNANAPFELIYDDPNPYGGIEVAAGVGNALAIRLNAAAVIGDSLRGLIEWEER